MTETLLILHVLAVAAWLGGGIYNLFLGPRIAGSGGPAAAAWIKAAAAASMRYFMPVSIVTLLTGIGLVLSDDAYDWSDLFVSIGLLVVVATLVIGVAGTGPAAKTAQRAIDEGDFAGAQTAGKKAANWGMVMVVLLIVSLVVMVLKTGAG